MEIREIKSREDISINEMDFPRTTNIKEWNEYMKCINKEITVTEKRIFGMLVQERHLNNSLMRLTINARKHNLYIPYLTDLDGNCLFASLKYLNIIDDISEFRKDLAFIMYYFGDYPFFEQYYPDQKETLKEIFTMTNEIEHVYSKNSSKYYKYDYDTMCRDLSNDNTWSRLPTQLILLVLSTLLDVHFIILSSNNDWENKIPHMSNSSSIIYLGHLDEVHYVPLKVIQEDNINNLQYTYAREKFIKWAREIYFEVHKNKYIIEKIENENS
jgi:hypothetical protein